MCHFRKKVFLWVLFCVLVGVISTSDVEASNVMKVFESEYTKQHPRSLLKYNTEQAQKNITDEDYLAYDLQVIIEVIAKLNDSQCKRDAITVMEAIARRERWAIQMFDASSKFPVGLLYGNFYQMGNFDECTNIHQHFTNANDFPIQGQYCLADVELFNKKEYDGRVPRSFEKLKKPRHVFNSTMFWSICVPSSCTNEEVQSAIKEIFTLTLGRKDIIVRLDEEKCHVTEKIPISNLEIIYGCVIGAFGVLILMATIFHLIHKKTGPSLLKRIILCFSIIRTTGKFLKTSSSDLNLNCICGIKFLSMVIIILGHTFLFLVGGPVKNTDFYDEESRNVANAIFVNSPLLVDTFLLIGAFLFCYILLKELDKRKSVNFLALYVGRYIRLTPSYLVVLGFYCTVFYRIADGPLWDSKIKLEQQRCLKSWWTNLLYVNNYVNTDYMCMFQSWYLAADFHLFIIAPFVIYSLWKWERVGKGILGTGIVVSVIIPLIITWREKLDPTLVILAPEVYDISQNFYFKAAYIKTHMRAGSYFFGLLFGYMLYKLQTKGTKLSKYVVCFGWLLAATCGIVSMTSVVVFYYPDHPYNPLEAAIYASFHRIAWSIFIGWVILVCVTNNAAVINNFLSWKPFVPLSRLTYCAYLVNGFVELYSAASIRDGVYMSKLDMATKSFAHAVMTFMLAFFLCIFFESPIHGLEKIILQWDAAKRRKPTVTNDISRETSSTQI